MDRLLACLGLCALTTACFDPEAPLGSDTFGTDTEDDTSGSGPGTSSDPTLPSTTDDPTTTSSTTNEPTSDTDDEEAVCGDGEVNGSEACDDGVNDGSYGGCAADCSAAAEYCGDGELNGPEACDDGVNDGAYGGCTAACELADFCGDGTINGPEDCDDGEANANGEGCNVDCVVSGSELGRHNEDDLSYCEGANVMQPQFNTMGNTYVVVGGQCSNDSVLLLEFDSDTSLVASHQDGLVFPNRNFQAFTAKGDDWLLSTYGCNFLISPDGVMTAEVCSAQQSDRYQGDVALEARDADTYLAMDGDDNIAIYGMGSPAADDSPNPLIVPDTGTGNWYFNDAAWGHANTVVQVGTYQFDFQSPYMARVFQYTAAGNVAASGYHNEVESYTAIEASPDGGYIVAASQPNPIIRKLNANLSIAWTQPITEAAYSVLFDVDSENQVVTSYRDPNNVWHVAKRSADGATELWNRTIDGWTGYSAAVSVAPDDSIWVVHQFQDITMQLDVLHLAP